MEEKNYTIILSNGSMIKDLRLNGNNFISRTKISKEIFKDNCSPVIISDGETEETHEHMELVQVVKYNNEWWFVLRDLSAQELKERKLRADIEYLSMMAGIEL